MNINHQNNETSALDSYMQLKKKQQFIQNQRKIKTHFRNQAIFQGLLAVSCTALGRYSLNRNNPFMFLICLACVRGAVEQHTKALAQYLTAHRHIVKSEKH